MKTFNNTAAHQTYVPSLQLVLKIFRHHDGMSLAIPYYDLSLFVNIKFWFRNSFGLNCCVYKRSWDTYQY